MKEDATNPGGGGRIWLDPEPSQGRTASGLSEAPALTAGLMKADHQKRPEDFAYILFNHVQCAVSGPMTSTREDSSLE